jgi:hypothetical protein
MTTVGKLHAREHADGEAFDRFFLALEGTRQEQIR